MACCDVDVSKMPSRRTWRLLFFVAICWNLVTFYIFVLPSAGPGAGTLHDAKLDHKSVPSLDGVLIPPDLKVVGLVFYGRKSTVEILDCYLKVTPAIFVLNASNDISEKFESQRWLTRPCHFRN